MESFNNVPDFNFIASASRINEITTSFDCNSCDDDSITGNTQIMIDYEDNRLTGVVMKNGQRFGHVFEPVVFNENTVEYDWIFLNELFNSTK